MCVYVYVCMNISDNLFSSLFSNVSFTDSTGVYEWPVVGFCGIFDLSTMVYFEGGFVKLYLSVIYYKDWPC